MKRLEIVEKEAVGANYLDGTFCARAAAAAARSTLKARDAVSNEALRDFPGQKAE